MGETSYNTFPQWFDELPAMGGSQCHTLTNMLLSVSLEPDLAPAVAGRLSNDALLAIQKMKGHDKWSQEETETENRKNPKMEPTRK